MTIETHHGRGYVYCLHYHIVWCVKHRHKVLTPEIVEDLVPILEKIANDNDFEILELNSSLQLLSRLLIAPSQCLQSLEQCA